MTDWYERAKARTIRELRKLADELETGEASLTSFTSDTDYRLNTTSTAGVYRWNNLQATFVWRDAK